MSNKVEQYIKSKDWSYKIRNREADIEICPFCSKDNYHFSINLDSEKWNCFVCGVGDKTLRWLKIKLGDNVKNTTSAKDALGVQTAVAVTLPNIEELHQKFLADEDAYDYVVDDRGISPTIVEQMKIGLDNKFFDKPKKHCKAIAFPYFRNGKCIYIKYRTLPPEQKDFISTPIADLPLYNEDVLVSGIPDILLVEGESDCLAALSNGITNVVGVPGAQNKKLTWLQKLDQIKPQKIYLCYDNNSDPNKVGQKAARELAIRIGIDKVYNIVLPEFTANDGRIGKDLNEWFRAGHTLEEFEELKADAQPFDIEGITSVSDLIDEIELDINQASQSAQQLLLTPWDEVNRLVGGFEWGDLVCVTSEAKIGKTTMCLNWIDYYARSKEIPSLMFCQEMLPKRLVRKWISFATQTPDSPDPTQSKFDIKTIQIAKDIVKTMSTDLLFGYTHFHKADEVFETIYQCRRRYGCRVVCFDNLHLLTRSVDNRATEIDTLSKRFKQMAMELQILMILIVQPTKIQKDEIISIRNSRGSAAIVQDLDTGISLHRNRTGDMSVKDLQVLKFIETEESFSPELFVSADATRYAPGGKTTLLFDGATSTVKSYPKELRETISVNSNGLVPVDKPEVTII